MELLMSPLDIILLRQIKVSDKSYNFAYVVYSEKRRRP